MRAFLSLVVVAIFAAACSDGSVDPIGPESAPIRASHTSPPGADLCSGKSPCDAYPKYSHEEIGQKGVWFLPPLVNDHSAFFGPTFITGLASILQISECDITAGVPGSDCRSSRVTEDISGEFYKGSFKFNKSDAVNREIHRIYVSIGDLHLAHRDVIVDPNDVTPADAALLAVGTGNIPIKVRVDDGITDCTPDATGNVSCVIGPDGQTFATGGTVVKIGAGNPTALYQAELCASGDYIDIDNPRVGPCLTIEAVPTITEALNASEIFFCGLTDVPPELEAKLFVHMVDDAGAIALPRVACPPELLGSSEQSGLLGYLSAGWGKMTALLGAEPLVATSLTATAVSPGGAGGRLGSLGSDFQLALPVTADKPADSGDGSIVRSSDLPIAAKVAVEDKLGARAEDATVHFYAEEVIAANNQLGCTSSPTFTGTCPAPSPDEPDKVEFRGTIYDYLAVVTGSNGIAAVDFAPDGVGERTLLALGCGIGVDGSDTFGKNWDGVVPSLDDDVLGVLQACDRDPTDVDSPPTVGNPEEGFANGPEVGVLDPFQPTSVFDDAVALNDLALSIAVTVCEDQGSPEDIDGTMDAAWACADSHPFTASLSGGSSTPARLLWMNDADNLYLGVMVERDASQKVTSLSFEFDNVIEPTADPNDDLWLLNVDRKTPADGEFIDMHLTSGCASSSGSSLCGDPDGGADGPDDKGAVLFNDVDAGNDFLFYEIAHDLCSGLEEDICADPAGIEGPNFVNLFLRLQMGKGGQGATFELGFRDYMRIYLAPSP